MLDSERVAYLESGKQSSEGDYEGREIGRGGDGRGEKCDVDRHVYDKVLFATNFCGRDRYMMCVQGLLSRVARSEERPRTEVSR